MKKKHGRGGGAPSAAAQARRDRDYGMVFQAPVLFDWRSVQGNVELPLELTGMGKADRAAKAKQLLQAIMPTDDNLDAVHDAFFEALEHARLTGDRPHPSSGNPAAYPKLKVFS